MFHATVDLDSLLRNQLQAMASWASWHTHTSAAAAMTKADCSLFPIVEAPMLLYTSQRCRALIPIDSGPEGWGLTTLSRQQLLQLANLSCSVYQIIFLSTVIFPRLDVCPGGSRRRYSWPGDSWQKLISTKLYYWPLRGILCFLSNPRVKLSSIFRGYA
ncbi:hypothetical protein GQ44DRAFT_699264 [Phaeosphaeriaceae sp. PMI808]|nr:hypothetical protein GQ44DRAFT_699264 [Phaeosphaeriaceae sp. PMI808]